MKTSIKLLLAGIMVALSGSIGNAQGYLHSIDGATLIYSNTFNSQRPFALVIVSGLFTRILISVFLMPVLYALMARTGDRLEV
jgi:hypothetical protein